MRLLRLLLFSTVITAFLAGCFADSGTRKDDATDIQQKITIMEKRMEAVEARQRNMVDVLAKARGAVAYIWGTYTFVDKEGRPLRHVVNDVQEPVADQRGVPLVDVKGTGPIAVSYYCGTAFLIGPKGEMLTNRHIAEPWWEDDKSAPLLKAGLKPVFILLRAFFQERAEGVPIEVLRIDKTQDIALIKTIGWVPAAPHLLLHPNPGKAEEGQPIFLIGYPTGLEAVMAKLEENERLLLEEQTGPFRYKTVEKLSRERWMRPTITSGFLWEVLPHLLVYDARTIGGGSGGPLLDWTGQVVGINAAYLEEFQGGNYGVPVAFGRNLLLHGGENPGYDAGTENEKYKKLYEKEQEDAIAALNKGKKPF